MFEEQAKEYEERKHHRYEDNDYCGDIADGIIQAYQQGAQFGYNKCKEELNHKGLALQSDMDKTIEQNIALKKELNKANEWHYVKDGDLPKEEGAVLIYWKCGDIKCASVVEPYKVTEDTHIIAWKEITLPEEE